MSYRLLSALGIFFVVACASLHADSVFVKTSPKPHTGTVKTEDTKGVTLEKGKASEFIPAADIVDIHYEDVKPATLRLAGGAYKVAKDKDKEANEATDPAKQKAALALAIKSYNQTLAQMEAHKYAARAIHYRIAVLTLRQAQNDKQPTATAIAKLLEYKDAYPTSWEINHVMPLIAQTQMDAGDFKGAEKTFEEMAGMDTLPADVKANAELMTVQVAVRAGNIGAAEKKLAALEKKAAGNPKFASRVKMAKAEVLVGQKKIDDAVPILHQVIKENMDRDTKALAHNTLGECYFKANRYNEAMWEFLWVDTVFNHDRNQHAKALYYLVQVFTQLNDGVRAEECRTMLESSQFTGTQWQQELLKKSSK
jgi:tetratricopeptide (TPR) repeat protein